MKKNILKFFTVLFTLAMFFSLASCGGKDKGKSESKKDRQKPKIAAGAESDVGGELAFAEPGGKDTDKSSGEISGLTDNGKQSGGKQEEKTCSEPEENDGEDEFIISSEGIQLPIVSLK